MRKKVPIFSSCCFTFYFFVFSSQDSYDCPLFVLLQEEVKSCSSNETRLQKLVQTVLSSSKTERNKQKMYQLLSLIKMYEKGSASTRQAFDFVFVADHILSMSTIKHGEAFTLENILTVLMAKHKGEDSKCIVTKDILNLELATRHCLDLAKKESCMYPETAIDLYKLLQEDEIFRTSKGSTI